VAGKLINADAALITRPLVELHVSKHCCQHKPSRAAALQLAMEAESAVLPPLQSVLELTSAHLPPSQQTATAIATAEGTQEMRGESAAGHLLEDGSGVLPDGSTWERLSGEEKGDNGYWCRRAAALRIALPAGHHSLTSDELPRRAHCVCWSRWQAPCRC
jgi:hypothetical protein